MQAILPSRSEWPLFDAATTQRMEAREREALAPHTLMRRAGLAVARLALALAPHAHSVWVAVGPGNNGGDGLEAAIYLHQWGVRVHVSLIGDASRLPSDANDAWQRAQAAGVVIHADGRAPLATTDLAIDALLGIGASRPAQGALAQAIAQLNALACPVLAVDLPSGLDAGTGQLPGAPGVVASHTLALLTLKPGLFTGSGRDHAGQVWFDTLGLDLRADAPTAWLAASRLAHPQAARRHAQHKGSFGDVAIVGGSTGMTGAAWLAARAALGAGAGRVFVELLADAAAVDPVCPELMFRPGWSGSAAEVLGRTTVVCGCGGGDAVRTPLPKLMSGAARLVLDADALNAIASDTGLQTQLTRRAAKQLPSVLTPHPLEAARLLGCSASEVQADRLAAAQSLADRFACCVVLKGSGSVIATKGQVPRINATGNAALATAGTGDVLAGWLGGLWAQAPSGSGFEVAIRAVREHGAAAEPPPPGPLCASDLIDALRRAPH